MTTLRGFITANNSATGVTSVATAYTGWTTANPQPGDLIVAVIFTAAASESITQTAGTGTWTIPSSDSNGATDSFTTAAAYRVMGATDTAPTFGWGTSAAYAYFMCAFIPDTSWEISPLDAEATVSVVTSAGTTQTPNAATAAGSGELSVILTGAQHQASGSNVITVSGPTGWTIAGNGGYGGGSFSTQIANNVSASYQTPVGPGTVTPGAETYSVSAAGNVYHLLFQEMASGSPDVPQIQPGPAWLNQFKPWIPKPRPPVPPDPYQQVYAAGSLSLAPFAVSGQANRSSPDVLQVFPGPTWLDLFKPGLPRPRPAVLPSSLAGAQGRFSLAPPGFSGQASQSGPDIREILPGPSWLARFKPGLPKPKPQSPPAPLNPALSTGGFTLAPLGFSGTGTERALYIFIGHYAVSYPDYVDSTTLEMLSCVPQQSYGMYVVSFRAGLVDPPQDGRWLGFPGLGDEIIFVRHYNDAFAIARSHNATLQAVNASKPYEQVSGGVPQIQEEIVLREPSEHSKMLSAGRALNAELQAGWHVAKKSKEHVTIGFPAGITESNVTSNAQARLMTLRYALESAENFYLWISNYSASDLEAAPLGLDSASAQALLNAFADAHELYNLYNGGALGSYTLPYNFSASQSVIIGPQG